MSISLSQNCQTDLNNASRSGVSNILSSLSTSLLSQNKWFDGHDINENYSAASTITHLEDAWSYFGKAIYSILNNDIYTSRHLAYYAELRACISLLATEGIIIKNNKHYFVDRNSRLNRINDIYHTNSGSKNTLGTHQMVWLAFEYWGTQDKARDLLENIININGVSLKDWVNAYDSIKWTGLTNEIYQQIGLDLQLMAKDKEVRNKVSYEPSQLYESNQSVSPLENIKFILEVWKLLEPTANNGFPVLDKFMLKNSLYLLDKKRGRKLQRSKRKKWRLINNIINKHRIDIEFAKEIFAFFQKENHEVFNQASATYSSTSDAIADIKNHWQVLSRALLLLRIATGSVQKILKDANISMNDISFWRKKIILTNGMLPHANINSFNTYDLWTDINDLGIDPLSNIGSTMDYYTIQQNESYPILLLSQAKRPLLWGIEY